MVSRTFILVLFTVLLAAVVATSDIRIVGGHQASEGQFPYQVSLQTRDKSHFCGGSILASKWILTAAHCLNKEPSDYLIKAGTSVWSGSSGGTYHRIARFRNHESWDPILIKNDIALIELEDEIEFSNLAQPIELETKVVGEVDAVVSGWGQDEKGKRPDNLKYLNTSTLTNEQCLAAWSKKYSPHAEICAFTAEGHDACSSDSGGPLVANGKQIGIVSWGTVPCGLTMPGLYTRVSSYIDWVHNVMSS
ncbi:Trypsin [Popillia japonica]|uniref:Trypsin n=1 Tax=Popillia japonica TaxID=7064 RepID=A0AAW1L723_POPJA